MCPRCPEIQPCPVHGKVAWAGSTRRQRLPSNWEKLRRFVLQRDPVCKLCDQRLSTEVDHIERGDDHNVDNLQGVCSPCHRDKTLREAAEARRLRRA